MKTKLSLPQRSNNTTVIANEMSRARKMLVLQGCVQSVVTAQTNQAATRILQKLDIELYENKQI